MSPLTRSSARLPFALLVVAPLSLFLAGCQTYRDASADLSRNFRSANIAGAVATADREAAARAGGGDELIWRLEQGAALRLAALADASRVPPPATEPVAPPPGETATAYAQRSTAIFDVAEERVTYWDEQARIKVASQSLSFLTNQANLPYRGRVYDKVMVNTYKALNYLQLGLPDNARVELNRALQHQRAAVELNQQRIIEAQSEADRAREGKVTDEKGQAARYDVDKARKDPATDAALSRSLAASTAPLKAYGDYVNPFAVFLDGLFFSFRGENGSDWERGRKSLERLAALVPENPYVTADATLAAAAAEGKVADNLVYVIFETGTAPVRDQVRIDIPTFLVGDGLSYVGAAFPQLAFNADYVPALSLATSDGQSLITATVASMDSIIANDFKNEWPIILTRTLITTATKAIIQAVVQKQLNDQGKSTGLFAALLLGVINYSTNIADTRTWITLPKEFQYARLTAPPDRRLTLTADGQTRTIILDPGSVNVVYVKSVATSTPLFVSQFLLK